MTDNPNIQKEILEFVLDRADSSYDAVDLREFAKNAGYEEGRVVEKAADTGVLEAGTSMLYPWYTNRKEVLARLEALA